MSTKYTGIVDFLIGKETYKETNILHYKLKVLYKKQKELTWFSKCLGVSFGSAAIVESFRCSRGYLRIWTMRMRQWDKDLQKSIAFPLLFQILKRASVGLKLLLRSQRNRKRSWRSQHSWHAEVHRTWTAQSLRASCGKLYCPTMSYNMCLLLFLNPPRHSGRASMSSPLEPSCVTLTVSRNRIKQ